MEPIEHYCETCEQVTEHTPISRNPDNAGCISADCNQCSTMTMIEVVDPDHARDVREDR